MTLLMVCILFKRREKQWLYGELFSFAAFFAFFIKIFPLYIQYQMALSEMQSIFFHVYFIFSLTF